MRQRSAAVALLLAAAGALTACGGASGGSDSGKPTQVKLGFFPNVTHATALVGVEKGIFTKYLGTAPKTAAFNAGPAAVEALFAKGIDATFVGPNPAINAWSQSHGQAIKIISGAASGGASLVVKPSIRSVADLKGKEIATPQLGNTQDVAARYYLKQQGLTANKDGSGDVKIVPQENSQTVDTFEQGTIDGAWVPEPFASRLVIEGKGRRLIDEKNLWPGGTFVTTHLIVRTDFAKDHPDLVKKLVQATVESTDYINDNPAEAKSAVNSELQKLTGKPLQSDVIDAAFKEITYTTDPVTSSLIEGAEHAEQVGLLKPVDLNGIYDLGPLNEVLEANGKAQVATR
ncbi:MAG TPA: ABC transporter substrate-binding protein [Streptosporangiaceae bacterium]|jgi:NitT/TauT family transport system substrate-binding protein